MGKIPRIRNKGTKNPIRNKYIIRNNKRFIIRTGTGFVTTTVDTDRVIFKRLCPQKISKSIGKKAWTHLDIDTIAKSYRSIILGLFNYYKETITYKRDLNWVHQLIKTSFAKTLCLKYKKKSMSVIFRKYGPDLIINKIKFLSKKNYTKEQYKEKEILTKKTLSSSNTIGKQDSKYNLIAAYAPQQKKLKCTT